MNELRRLKKWLLALTLCMFLVACGGTSYEKKQMAKKTLEQLERDYKEEFEIESVNYVRENDSYVIYVHPKAEPDISFRVVKWKMAGNKLIDNYIPLRRALQTRKLFKPFADSISTKNLLHANITGAEKSIKIFGLEDQDAYWDLTYPVKDLIRTYHENTRVMVDIFYFFDLNENNTEAVCKKVYEMIKYIQDLKVGEVNISIQFYDEKFFKDKDVEKILEKEGSAGMMNFVSHYGDYRANSIQVDNRFPIMGIKNYKDIEKLIWYKKHTGEKNNIGEEKYKWIQK